MNTAVGNLCVIVHHRKNEKYGDDLALCDLTSFDAAPSVGIITEKPKMRREELRTL